MDQLDNLLEAREAEPELGFMARMLALCSLPRTDPGARTYYKRVNGPYRLFMNAGADNKLPYGSIPRLLLAWTVTQAVRTRKRELVLGRSLSNFMGGLGVQSDSGGKRGELTRFRKQMIRLFGCTVSLVYEGRDGYSRVSSLVADRHEFWWDPKQPAQASLWESRIELGEKFFNEIIRNPVPLNLNVLKALKRSPLGLDLYLWLNYRTFSLEQPIRLSWKRLYRQLGGDRGKGTDKDVVKDFRKKVSPRIEKDPDSLAGPELLDRSRCVDCRSVKTRHRGTVRRIKMLCDHLSSRPFYPHQSCDPGKFSPLKQPSFFAPVSAETAPFRAQLSAETAPPLSLRKSSKSRSWQGFPAPSRARQEVTYSRSNKHTSSRGLPSCGKLRNLSLWGRPPTFPFKSGRPSRS